MNEYRYDPYGQMLEGDAGDPFLYTGQQYDPAAELYYLRARYYDPRLGRFLARDPIAGLLELPQTLNPYSYARNDPVNLSDPSGQFAPLLVAAAAIGGMIAGGWAGATLYSNFVPPSHAPT